MNLDELELYKSQELQEGVCELNTGKKELTKEEAEIFNDDTSTNDKLLDECVEKLMRYLFGKSWQDSIKEKSRKEVRKIVSKTLQLEVVEQTETDLGETLDLLEDSLFLLERILAKHAHSVLNVEMVEHMETVAEHLEQWGMGDSKASEKRVLDQMKDRFRD